MGGTSASPGSQPSGGPQFSWPLRWMQRARGLFSQALPWFLAPRGDGTRASVLEASPRLFVDRPDFFDYPDSDQASLLAVAQFIGEKPVTFVKTGMNQLG